METMKDFVGSRLTHGAFHQMNAELLALTAGKEAALKIETQATHYESAVNTLGTLINRVSAYAETPELERHDRNRDALFNSLYYAIYYLRHLDRSHSLWAHVNLLLPVISAYKGMNDHEITKQTSEVDGLIAELSKTENADALKAIGLLPTFAALDEANSHMRTSLATRTTTAATRSAAVPQVSTDDARSEVVDVYRQIVARVNAVAQLESTPDVVAFIRQANAVAEHYTLVMANQAKKQEKK